MRDIAAKNCASEGYTHLPSEDFGMDEVSRSVERGAIERMEEDGDEKKGDQVEREV